MSQTSSAGGSLESLVGQIVDEFTQKLQRGERPEVEEYVSRHPQVAEVLRQVLPTLQALQSVAGQPDSVLTAPDGEGMGGILGDFRIVRQIGRGGMGVVYEAEQISLGRRVALKVLSFAAVLDPRQLQRFRNEAQAAAQIHHTNIVPVYTVGSDRGVYFYAMQYIEGQTLADVIEELRALSGLDQSETPDIPPPVSEVTTALIRGPAGSDDSRQAGLPTDRPAVIDASSELHSALSDSGSIHSWTFFHSIAGLGVQAAQALEHAHQLGVIHRDIKPSNLLLDARGNVWITDFGLASVRSADQTLTMPGDLLGTLRYMSPEQAQGESGVADRRTDIYSLGATLYELLTLRPAFTGHNRHEMLHRIIEQPPHAPRQLNDAIPPDLETILLKSMAKDPAERYASAAQMAEDLRRFQDHRPILARPPTVLERLSKWSRRHTAAVAAALGVLLLLALGLAVSTAMIAREQGRTATALASSQEQRRRSDANLQEALGAVDRMLTRVGQAELAKVPMKLRREVLTDALRFYGGFLRSQSADPAVCFETARTYRRMGDIQRMLADHSQAEQAYRQAVQLLTDLARQYPQPPYRYELAISQRRLSGLLQELKRPDEAKPLLNDATQVLAGLVGDVPSEPRYWQELAEAHLQANHSGPAGEAIRRAMALEQQTSTSVADDSTRREALAEANHSLGEVLQQEGHPQQAAEAYAAGLRLYESLAAQQPNTPRYRDSVGQLEFHEGEALQQAGQLEQAESHLRRAVQTLKPAAAESQDLLGPDSPYQHLIRAYPVLADVLTQTGRWQEGLGLLREGLALHSQVLQETAHLPALQENVVANRAAFDKWVVDTGIYSLLDPQQESVTQALRMSADIMRRMIAQAPDRPEYRDQLGRMLLSLHYAEKKDGSPTKALELTRQAQDLYEQLAAEYPAEPRYREYQAVCVRVVAQLMDYHLNQPVEAEKGYRQAVQLWRKMLEEPELRDRYWEAPIYDLTPLGTLLFKQGRLVEAEQVLKEVLDLNEPVMAAGIEHINSPNYSLHIILSWFTLSDVLAETNRLVEAETLCAKAVWFAHDRVSTLKNPTQFSPLEAEACWRQGQILRKMQHREEAGDAMVRAIEIRKGLLAQALSASDIETAQSPEKLIHLAQVADLQMILATQLSEMGQAESAEAATANALDTLATLANSPRLANEPPGLPLASYDALVEALIGEGHAGQAERLMRNVVTVRNRFAKRVKDLQAATEGWIGTFWPLATERERAGDVAAAEQTLRQGMEVAKQQAAQQPNNLDCQRPLWGCHRKMAQFLVRQGRFDEAAGLCNQILPAVEQAIASGSSQGWPRWYLLNLHVIQADVLSHAGRSEKAEVLYRQSIAEAKALAADPSSKQGYEQLAEHYASFGEYWLRAGLPEEAIRMHGQALEVWKDLAAKAPDIPGHRVRMAACHRRLAELSAHVGLDEQAAGHWREALRLVEALGEEAPSGGANVTASDRETLQGILTAASQPAGPYIGNKAAG